MELIKRNNDLQLNKLKSRFLDYIDVSPKTIETYEIGLLNFFEYIDTKNIKTPCREDIIGYREHLKLNYKPTTVNSYLNATRNFYKWLEYEGITKDITKNVKTIKLEKRHLKNSLSQKNIDDIIGYCSNLREELLVKLMLTTALRVNEVINIQLEDFYIDNDTVMLRVLGKARGGYKQDSVKIDNRINELIQNYIKEYNITDYLFVSTSNNNTNNKLNGITVRRILNSLYEKAGIKSEKLTAHSTRKTAINIALEQGASIQETMEFARQKNVATTMVYVNELNKTKSEIANQIANSLF